MPIPRHRLINFRLTDDEYRQLLVASQNSGSRNLSDFTRTTLLSSLKPNAPPLETAIGRLTAAVNDLISAINTKCSR